MVLLGNSSVALSISALKPNVLMTRMQKTGLAGISEGSVRVTVCGGLLCIRHHMPCAPNTASVMATVT